MLSGIKGMVTLGQDSTQLTSGKELKSLGSEVTFTIRKLMQMLLMAVAMFQPQQGANLFIFHHMIMSM